jgi:hypothetical protein
MVIQFQICRQYQRGRGGGGCYGGGEVKRCKLNPFKEEYKQEEKEYGLDAY